MTPGSGDAALHLAWQALLALFGWAGLVAVAVCLFRTLWEFLGRGVRGCGGVWGPGRRAAWTRGWPASAARSRPNPPTGGGSPGRTRRPPAGTACGRSGGRSPTPGWTGRCGTCSAAGAPEAGGCGCRSAGSCWPR
ncbi:hypothetical protein LT493_39550 [Streptomyces tricolor]|nr:hypothetical protein [Streptomyces tricolor]